MMNQTSIRDAGIYHSLSTKAVLILSTLSLCETVMFNIAQINSLRQRTQCYLHSYQADLR